MKITKDYLPETPPLEPISGSFYSLAQLLSIWWDKHNLDEKLATHTMDEVLQEMIRERNKEEKM